jgi:glycosyltransferase involved in cell wall biosynthesis
LFTLDCDRAIANPLRFFRHKVALNRTAFFLVTKENRTILRAIKLICVSYSPDTSVEAEMRKGAFDILKETIENYSRLDEILLLTNDSKSYSNSFDGSHRVLHCPCGSSRSNKYFSFLHYYLKGFRTLIEYRAKINAVISMMPACAHDDLFSILLKRPHMLTYEYDLPTQLSKINKDYLSAFFSRPVERLSIKNASLVRILSQDQYEKIRRLTKTKIVLIPNFVDTLHIDELRNKLSNGKYVCGKVRILFVGRLHPVKRVDDLIHAFSFFLKRSSCSAKLVIIGDGPERERLQSLTKELSCAESVVFTGFLPHDEVLRHMLSCDMLVLPSLEEGNPRTIIEGLACKIVIIATDVLGIRAIIQNGVNGILIPPRDPNALASAIQRIVNDDGLRTELVRNGFQLAKSQYEKKVCFNRLNHEVRILISEASLSSQAS